MMMGRGLVPLEQAQAGNIIAIGGLDQAILKSATLMSTAMAIPLAPMLFQVPQGLLLQCLPCQMSGAKPTASWSGSPSTCPQLLPNHLHFSRMAAVNIASAGFLQGYCPFAGFTHCESRCGAGESCSDAATGGRLAIAEQG